MKKIKSRRKNPAQEDLDEIKLLDEFEFYINRYDQLLKFLIRTRYWSRCKNVIIYYLTFLQGLQYDITFVITSGFPPFYKWASSPHLGEYILQQYDIGLFLGKYDIIDNLHYQINLAKETYISEKKIELLTEYLTTLKMNYGEFFKDIQNCKNLPEPPKMSDKEFSEFFKSEILPKLLMNTLHKAKTTLKSYKKSARMTYGLKKSR